MGNPTFDPTATWSSPNYAARVAELEAEGLTTSDAQGIADVEFGVTAAYVASREPRQQSDSKQGR